MAGPGLGILHSFLTVTWDVSKQGAFKISGPAFYTPFNMLFVTPKMLARFASVAQTDMAEVRAGKHLAEIAKVLFNPGEVLGLSWVKAREYSRSH